MFNCNDYKSNIESFSCELLSWNQTYCKVESSLINLNALLLYEAIVKFLHLLQQIFSLKSSFVAILFSDTQYVSITVYRDRNISSKIQFWIFLNKNVRAPVT